MTKTFIAEPAQHLADEARDKMLGRKYRHYKGYVYRVTDVVVDEATGAAMVVYERKGDRWCRTLTNFTETVLTEQRGRVEEIK